MEQGRKKNTARAYTNAMRNLISTLDAVDRAQLETRGPPYVARALAGEGLAKSDKVYARPALRALLSWLDKA